MSGEWHKFRIDEIAKKITIGPFGSRMKSDLYTETGVPVIRGTNLTGGRVLTGDWVYVSNETADGLTSCTVVAGDLVFPHRGAIGEVGIVPGGRERYILSSSLMMLRANALQAHSLYLYYFFKSREGQHELLKNASQVGTPGIGQPLTSLKSIEVSLPEIEEQRTIAHILGTLDDKIELNRRMNETLEAIARAMFKSWFVDFDPVRAKMSGEPPESICQRLGLTPDLLAIFPDRLVDSELGEIPEGWIVGAFHSCCDRIESGGTPSRSVAEYWNGTISWLTSGEVRDVIVLETKEKITIAGLNSSSAKVWPRGTTVVAMYGATAGQVCLLAEEMTANQACCALIPKPEFVSFVFLTARASITQLSDKASGSAQQNLNKSLVANHQLILPTLKTAGAFEGAVSCLFGKWISNQRECESLAVVRDNLLPKLLSGELHVSEADSDIEVCA